MTLGYEVDRVAARVVSDGALRTPANHHPLVVEIERRYVVDVGTGPPMIRQPVPLLGAAGPDDADVEWRVTESDRPDAAYRTEYRGPDASEWTPRYVFDDVSRPFHYFEAANDYLQTAPESPFTGAPIVALSTDTGYRTLSDNTLTEVTSARRHERSVTGDAWYDTLKQAFGLSYERTY